MAKKNKYDTDPLDPEVEGRASQEWTPPTGPEPYPSPELGQTPPGQSSGRGFADAEGPTRILEPKGYTAYQSVFEQQTSAPSVPLIKKIVQPPTSRIIPGINLAENFTLVLPYIPFYVGGIAAVIELFLVPRSETRVRFHAAQGLALHIVVLAISTVLGFLNSFSGARIGGIGFSIAATILFVVSMIRVWKGEPHHIAPVDDLTSWLDDKIKPRK